MSEEKIIDRIAFGKKISQIRKDRGLSQEDLGNMAGVTQINISRIESGKYSVGLDILLRIGKALDLDLMYVLFLYCFLKACFAEQAFFFVLSFQILSAYFCAMQKTIHVYDAIKQMQALSMQAKPFSFAFYKYDRKRRTGGDLARISRASLRKKTADTRIAGSSFKLFFTDLDSGKPLNCWQILIVEFNGIKCTL